MIRKLLLPILMIVFLTICNAQNFVYSTVGSPELRYTIISQGEKHVPYHHCKINAREPLLFQVM